MRKLEYKKFNPENIVPQQFMRSATEAAGHTEIVYIAKQVEAELQGKVFPPTTIKEKAVGLGSEFEILFFSPEMDPHEAEKLDESNNPNYSAKHQRKMDCILSESEKFVQKNSKFFWRNPLERIGRLMFEYRTAPFPLSGYLEAVNLLRDHVIDVSNRFGVWPVVYSQHLHTSLTGAQGNVLKPFFESDYYSSNSPRASFRKNMSNFFRQAAPFVLLPEEFEPVDYPFYQAEVAGNRHVEFRQLASEYANDPGLNALLCLQALHHGLNYSDPVYDGSGVKHSFRDEAKDLRSRQALKSVMGQSLLGTLASVVEKHHDISARKKTVADVAAKY